MSYRVAVNGFGRIGRNYLRCLLERGLLERGVDVVGVNDLWDAATLAHLLQNDTTFGRLRWDVDHDDANMRVGGASIPTYRENAPMIPRMATRAVPSATATTSPTPRHTFLRPTVPSRWRLG